MFVSTQSSFVANKLSLNNLIVLGKSSGIIQSQRISDLEDYDFFAKVPNYPTLRVALCDKAILVEGPTDEIWGYVLDFIVQGTIDDIDFCITLKVFS